MRHRRVGRDTIRRWSIRYIAILPILLIILGWWQSASAYDRLAYGRGHACIAAGMNEGVFFFDLFSSSSSFRIGAKYAHETRSPANFWPPASAPAPAHIWQGLGYTFQRFADGWQFRFCLPFWFLLLFFAVLAIYIFRRTRRRRPPSAFSVEPLLAPAASNG